MRVRVSVANLVPRVIVAETGASYIMGLLNRRCLERGEEVYGAVGGSAELTDAGVRLLREQYGAEFEKGRDARMLIDLQYLDEVMRRFEVRDPAFCEVDPAREVREELTTAELPGFSAVLSVQDAQFLHLHYVKSRHQAGGPTEARASARPGDPLSQRYFHLFEMVAPRVVFTRLKAHPAVRMFTEEEVATTKQGLMRGLTEHGLTLGTNLFW